jgi:hypothetical protein
VWWSSLYGLAIAGGFRGQVLHRSARTTAAVRRVKGKRSGTGEHGGMVSPRCGRRYRSNCRATGVGSEDGAGRIPAPAPGSLCQQATADVTGRSSRGGRQKVRPRKCTGRTPVRTGELCESGFTHLMDLEITIGGEPFANML